MTRRTIAAGTLADLRALLAQANTLADTLRAALSAADSEPKPTAPARTAQVKRGACPEIECPHGLSIAGEKRARWSGRDLLGRTALGVERIGLVKPSYGSGLWLAIYKGKTAALPGTEEEARDAVEDAARADGWEIV